MKCRIIQCLFLMVLVSTAQGKQESPSADDSSTVKIMDQFLEQLTDLKKYLISAEVFADPQNKADISKHLKEFSRLTKEARHNPTLNQENFKFSRDVLENHVTETERLFESGNRDFARWRLLSTVNVCMTCHSQMPASDRSMSAFVDSKIFASDFDQAEFLFATRSFDKAFSLYQKVIDGYPVNGATSAQVENALERELAYFSRVKRSPDEGLKVLSAHLETQNLPFYIQENVKAWIGQFRKWKDQKDIDPRKASDQQIINFAKSMIDVSSDDATLMASSPQLVSYLRASSILYEFLQTHPQSKVVPDVLYWLSLCDRFINENFFYSLADLYLRECIIKYPEMPIAKKCFKEYEFETVVGYSGSRGEDVPGDVRADLNYLKKLVDTQGKVNVRIQ